MDVNSLAHTKWDCKYHIVFAPKYRRQVIYKDIKADVGQILGTLCRRKGIEIIEAECCSDHIHADKNSTEIFRVRNSGIFERKKLAYDI